MTHPFSIVTPKADPLAVADCQPVASVHPVARPVAGPTEGSVSAAWNSFSTAHWFALGWLVGCPVGFEGWLVGCPVGLVGCDDGWLVGRAEG